MDSSLNSFRLKLTWIYCHFRKRGQTMSSGTKKQYKQFTVNYIQDACLALGMLISGTIVNLEKYKEYVRLILWSGNILLSVDGSTGVPDCSGRPECVSYAFWKPGQECFQTGFGKCLPASFSKYRNRIKSIAVQNLIPFYNPDLFPGYHKCLGISDLEHFLVHDGPLLFTEPGLDAWDHVDAATDFFSEMLKSPADRHVFQQFTKYLGRGLKIFFARSCFGYLFGLPLTERKIIPKAIKQFPDRSQ